MFKKFIKLFICMLISVVIMGVSGIIGAIEWIKCSYTEGNITLVIICLILAFAGFIGLFITVLNKDKLICDTIDKIIEK